MIKRWILYLLTLLGAILFWVAHQGHLSWLLLVVIAALPLLSLLLSLLPILLVRPSLQLPDALVQGQNAMLQLSVRSGFPLPPYHCQWTLTHSLTGEKMRLRPGDILPTTHCGLLTCHCRGFFVEDYLGLFRFRRYRIPQQTLLIRPIPVEVPVPKTLDRLLSTSWQPKPSGGFAENHDLRLYRPGDSLNQIHWKLTAKTGKLMIREPLIPRHGRIVLSVHLQGTPEQMDSHLGKLLYLGDHLLVKNLAFEIHAMTGSGPMHFPVADSTMLVTAVDALLACSPLKDAAPHHGSSAVWHYHIGGDADEE